MEQGMCRDRRFVLAWSRFNGAGVDLVGAVIILKKGAPSIFKEDNKEHDFRPSGAFQSLVFYHV